MFWLLVLILAWTTGTVANNTSSWCQNSDSVHLIVQSIGRNAFAEVVKESANPSDCIVEWQDSNLPLNEFTTNILEPVLHPNVTLVIYVPDEWHQRLVHHVVSKYLPSIQKIVVYASFEVSSHNFRYRKTVYTASNPQGQEYVWGTTSDGTMRFFSKDLMD